MARLFFMVLALFLFSAPLSAEAKSGGECRGKLCECWKRGTCDRVRKPTTCLVEVFAPTYGGKATLEMFREDGSSVFPDALRIKRTAPGIVSWNIGCFFIKQAYRVDLCVCREGPDGKCLEGPEGLRATSIRWREDVLQALETRRLELCALGSKCPQFVDGPPPPRP